MRRTLIGLVYDVHVVAPEPEAEPAPTPPDELAKRREQIVQDEAEFGDLIARLDEQDVQAAILASERQYTERMYALFPSVPKPVALAPRSRERALGIVAGVLLAAAFGVVWMALR